MVSHKGSKGSNRTIVFAFALTVAGVSLTAAGWLFADEEANSDQNSADNEIPATYKEKWERSSDLNQTRRTSKSEALPDSIEERMLSPGAAEVQMPDICERPEPPDWCFDLL